MKKFLTALTTTLALGLGISLAQAAPEVDISALTIENGTISEYVAQEAQPLGGCDLDRIRAEASETTETDLEASSRFSCFNEALQATGLAETLSDEGSYTVFAPTDKAFADFAEDLGVTTFSEALEDTERLTEILRYHVSPVGQSLNDLRVGIGAGTLEVETLQGSPLELDFPLTEDVATVTINGEALPGGEAYVTGRSIDVDNGYLIPIGEVLIPPTTEMPPATQ